LKKTIFFDIDGVLYSSGEILPGAVEAFNSVQNKFNAVLLSNSVRKTKQEYCKQFLSDGFKVDVSQFCSVLDSAKRFLSGEAKDKKVCFFCREKVKKEFEKEGFSFVELQECDMVLLAFYPDMTWNNMNKVFQAVFLGAELVLIEGDKWGLAENGKVLGPGSIAGMIDNVCGCGFRVIGKPSKQFFENALKQFNAKPGHSVMVGDNYAVDIVGAANVGMKTIFVRSDVPQTFFGNPPSATVESAAEIKKVAEKMFVK